MKDNMASDNRVTNPQWRLEMMQWRIENYLPMQFERAEEKTNPAG